MTKTITYPKAVSNDIFPVYNVPGIVGFEIHRFGFKPNDGKGFDVPMSMGYAKSQGKELLKPDRAQKIKENQEERVVFSPGESAHLYNENVERISLVPIACEDGRHRLFYVLNAKPTYLAPIVIMERASWTAAEQQAIAGPLIEDINISFGTIRKDMEKLEGLFRTEQ